MTSISIVVPIYKTPINFLKQCIDSILRQDYPYFEVILVDDGSPDECGDICDQYTHIDSRCRVIHQSNQGVAAARNTGINQSTSEWITFIDPDDWIEYNYLSTFIKMSSKTDAEILISSCFVNYSQRQVQNPFFKDNTIEATGIQKDRFIIQFLCANIYRDNLGTADSGSPWAKFYKRTFLNKYNLRFNPSLARMEDNTFNIEAYTKATKIYFENKYLYHYRKSLYSGFSRYTDNIENYYEIFLSFLRDFIIQEHKGSIFEEAFNIKVLNSIYVYCKMKYFHQKNPLNFQERLQTLQDLLNKPLYTNAISNLNYKYLSPLEKIFAFSLKSPILVWFLITAKERIFHLTGKGL